MHEIKGASRILNKTRTPSHLGSNKIHVINLSASMKNCSLQCIKIQSTDVRRIIGESMQITLNNTECINLEGTETRWSKVTRLECPLPRLANITYSTARFYLRPFSTFEQPLPFTLGSDSFRNVTLYTRNSFCWYVSSSLPPSPVDKIDEEEDCAESRRMNARWKGRKTRRNEENG